MLRSKLVLISILILAAVLRFWNLGANPPALDWDETAHGYNAYSILKTGRDEYGYKFPLFFRSFDDYKPPLYTYLVVPSVAVFGLNDFAVRFPSALLGVLAVLFTYLMVKELFAHPRGVSQVAHLRGEIKTTPRPHLEGVIESAHPGGVTQLKNVALLAAFFLAISPWHLQFSRVAFETNSATFWSVLGTWAFLRGIRSENFKITAWMSLAALAFGANLFMYHNARVFVPIYTLVLVILFFQKLRESIRYLLVPIAISALFIALLVPIIFSISGQLRYKGTTIFADVSPQYKASELIAQDEESGNVAIGKVFHNRRLVYIPILVDNYLSHLRPTYLFFTADMERHHAPGVGLLYLWDLPFILAGIYFLIKNQFSTKTKIIIFWWFLIAPLASTVTWGVPHSLRSEIYLPTYQIFAAVGVVSLYQVVKLKRLFAALAAVGLLVNFLYYLHQYHVHMPIEFSKAWLYGRREAAQFTENIKGQYERVIVSTKLEQPHEFWLYYLVYDPKKYLTEGGTVSGGFLEDRNKFDKYLFRPVDYQKQKAEAKTLFVTAADELPGNARLLKRIDYLNGEPAIYIVE